MNTLPCDVLLYLTTFSDNPAVSCIVPREKRALVAQRIPAAGYGPLAGAAFEALPAERRRAIWDELIRRNRAQARLMRMQRREASAHGQGAARHWIHLLLLDHVFVTKSPLLGLLADQRFWDSPWASFFGGLRWRLLVHLSARAQAALEDLVRCAWRTPLRAQRAFLKKWARPCNALWYRHDSLESKLAQFASDVLRLETPALVPTPIGIDQILPMMRKSAFFDQFLSAASRIDFENKFVCYSFLIARLNELIRRLPWFADDPSIHRFQPLALFVLLCDMLYANGWGDMKTPVLARSAMYKAAPAGELARP